MTPNEEQKIRRELGEALMAFMTSITTIMAEESPDDVMRRVATEKLRQAVESAASRKIGVSLTWHTLAVWTESGKERIGYFSKAMDCVQAESAANPPKSPREKWSAIHMQADCLFEIGRVHFHEGAPEAARDFLVRALPLARQADALQKSAGVRDDRLEGRIAELLLQLPDATNAGQA
jgi:hypothetical protein